MSGAKKIATMPRFSDLSIMNLALVLPAVPIPARTAVVPMRGATRKKTPQYEKLPPSKTMPRHIAYSGRAGVAKELR